MLLYFYIIDKQIEMTQVKSSHMPPNLVVSVETKLDVISITKLEKQDVLGDFITSVIENRGK